MSNAIEQIKQELEIIKVIQNTLVTDGVTALAVYKVLKKPDFECAKKCGRCCCKESKCGSCILNGECDTVCGAKCTDKADILNEKRAFQLDLFTCYLSIEDIADLVKQVNEQFEQIKERCNELN